MMPRGVVGVVVVAEPVCDLFLCDGKCWARVWTVAAAVWPGRWPQPELIVLQAGAETWTVNCCFDLTWKKLIDFCVTEKLGGGGEMLAAHLTACMQKHLREGREGMKREITSHPAPFLLNYSNLTHMDWPPWLTGGGGAGERAEGIPSPGDHSSYLWMR